VYVGEFCTYCHMKSHLNIYIRIYLCGRGEPAGLDDIDRGRARGGRSVQNSEGGHEEY